MITGDACSIRARTYRQSHLQHPPNRRLAFHRFDAIATDVVLALVRHAMLNSDATTERSDSLHVWFGDRFALIDEPPQIVDRELAVNAFEDVEEPRDRLVVRGVNSPR